MVDPKGIEPSNLTDANRALSQLSYGPILPFLRRFCNKLQLLQLFDFNGFQRKITLKSWTNSRWSMCDHRDANRTLSQLSYRPKQR